MWKTILALLAATIVLNTSAYAGQYNTVLSIGDDMPAFNDLPITSGDTLSSSELKADIVVLVSLANHCPWVQGMDAQLVDLARKYQDKNIDIVAFSVNHREDDRLPAMKTHAAEHGYTFPYAYDESQQLGRDLGATRTPEYFVFNRERKLVYMGLITDSPARKTPGGDIRFINGEPTTFYVEDAIDALLNDRPVPVTETRAHGCTVKYAS